MIREKFKKLNEITVGDCLTFPVSLQMIPSSRSMLSRDKRLPLDKWNTWGLQENVFDNQFSTFDSHRDPHQGIHLAHHNENEDQFHKQQGWGHLSQEMTNKVKTQFQCRHLQEGRRLRVL